MTHLFTPLTIKSVTLRNRIVASPMCQYMAHDGELNEWHQSHYAMLARGGAALVVVEATAVAADGRITPGDAGLWNDRQIVGFEKVARSIRMAGAVAGIQLSHAGRKAGCTPPWQGGAPLQRDDPQAWTPIAPSAAPYVDGSDYVPEAMTHADIKRVQRNFADAASRALSAGFQWLELHFAHGFLGMSFLSKQANHRTDEYGESLENRARFLLETVEAVKAVWPADLPLTVRLGALEFGADQEATREETITVLRWMKDAGLDLVDVGLAGISPAENVPWGPNFMVPYATRIREETGLLVGTSWFITDPAQADGFVRDASVDLIFIARSLLANPHWPYEAARTLGVDEPEVILPRPYAYWLNGWSPQ